MLFTGWVPWIPEPSRRFNLLFTVEGSGIQGTGWEVRIEKYFVEVSKTARGRRPRDVFETETKYFSIRTDLNVFIFLSKTQRQMATVLLDCAYRKQNNKNILIFNYFTLENKQSIKIQYNCFNHH
jgi:hypothetical protein